jgi:hypothetical protein
LAQLYPQAQGSLFIASYDSGATAEIFDLASIREFIQIWCQLSPYPKPIRVLVFPWYSKKTKIKRHKNVNFTRCFKRNLLSHLKGKMQIESVREERAEGNICTYRRGNTCFENVTHFRYLGTTITNQNLIQEEIKRILNSGNAC